MDYKSPLDPPSAMNEINLTPFIDLSFLLLITFIITFPLVEQGIPVNLPTATAAELPQDKSKTITVNLGGDLFIGERKVTPDELAAEMQLVGNKSPDTVVYVKADEALRYGRIVEILRILHDAKVPRMALITQGEQEARRP